MSRLFACSFLLLRDVLHFGANGKVAEIGVPEGENGAIDIDPYQQSIDALLAEGKIPIASDGTIELGAEAICKTKYKPHRSAYSQQFLA